MNYFAELTNFVKQYRLNNLEHNYHYLEPQELLDTIEEAREVLDRLPNVIEIRSSKLVVIGDIHGTYEAMLQAIPPQLDPQTIYIFLGDYVDRGFFGIEVIYALMKLFIANQRNVILLRGNHECRHVSFQYGLFFEIFVKYTHAHYQNVDLALQIFDALVGLFLSLPIAAFNEDFVFLHAGIPGNGSCLEDLNKIERRRDVENQELGEISEFDPLSDVLWADFDANQPQLFTRNAARGVSIVFNDLARERFTGGRQLVRSHTAVNGVFKAGGVITVFSVPHYDGANKGAYLTIEGSAMSFKSFNTPRHAWIDNQPVFQSFSTRNNKNMVFGIVLGLFDVEIEPNFDYLVCEGDYIFKIKKEQRMFLSELIMDYYERCSESTLQLLSMIDNVEECVKISGKSLAQWGYVFPRIYIERLSVQEVQSILDEFQRV